MMTENSIDIGRTFRPKLGRNKDAGDVQVKPQLHVNRRAAPKLPKIPARYRHLIFGVIQSGLTCAVAAAIASLPFYAEGSFASHWIHTYLYSWMIMLPVVVIAAPVIRRIVDAITH